MSQFSLQLVSQCTPSSEFFFHIYCSDSPKKQIKNSLKWVKDKVLFHCGEMNKAVQICWKGQALGYLNQIYRELSQPSETKA